MKKALYILGEMDDSDIQWLIGAGKKEIVAAEQTLIEEGKPIDGFYLVIEGNFSVRVRALNNKEVAQVGAGEVLGEMSYVDSHPPSATVVAIERGLVLSIPRVLLSEKLAQDMSFAAHFYRALSVFLAHRLRGTVGQLGYGEADDSSPDEEQMDEDELDLDELDHATMGGARFDQILRQLKDM